MNDGARPLRIRVSVLAAGCFGVGVGGLGANPLAACSRESTKRNLHMFHRDLVSQRPSNNVYEQGLAEGHTSMYDTLAALALPSSKKAAQLA